MQASSEFGSVHYLNFSKFRCLQFAAVNHTCVLRWGSPQLLSQRYIHWWWWRKQTRKSVTQWRRCHWGHAKSIEVRMGVVANVGSTVRRERAGPSDRTERGRGHLWSVPRLARPVRSVLPLFLFGWCAPTSQYCPHSRKGFFVWKWLLGAQYFGLVGVILVGCPQLVDHQGCCKPLRSFRNLHLSHGLPTM